MRYGVAIALPCLILAAQARVARTQTPSPPAQQIPTLSSESTLVVVPALVRNRAGELIFALNVDDFILADDGIPQKLTLEHDTGGEPLALVVLIEAGAATKSVGWHPNTPDSPPDRFSTLPTMIEAMAGNVPHEIAVVGFDSGPELLQDFTTNMDSVADTIRDLCANIDGDGGAAILDSLGFALDLLGKQPRQYRRAILLLNETNDRGSKLKLDDALRAERYQHSDLQHRLLDRKHGCRAIRAQGASNQEQTLQGRRSALCVADRDGELAQHCGAHRRRHSQDVSLQRPPGE